MDHLLVGVANESGIDSDLGLAHNLGVWLWRVFSAGGGISPGGKDAHPGIVIDWLSKDIAQLLLHVAQPGAHRVVLETGVVRQGVEGVLLEQNVAVAQLVDDLQITGSVCELCPLQAREQEDVEQLVPFDEFVELRRCERGVVLQHAAED